MEGRNDVARVEVMYYCGSMLLAEKTRFGPYEIVSLLGAGGMGEVYEARDTRLERTESPSRSPAHSTRPTAKAWFTAT
jgi:eukaryotic-like serine/threonine-protein kinase